MVIMIVLLQMWCIDKGLLLEGAGQISEETILNFEMLHMFLYSHYVSLGVLYHCILVWCWWAGSREVMVNKLAM